MFLIEQTTVAATALPIAEFKDHLRLGTGFSDDDVQDSILETCIRSAVAAIEGRTGKALIERQFLQSVTCWRTSDWHAIPIAPVSSIVSVSVLDRAGAPTLIDPGQGVHVVRQPVGVLDLDRLARHHGEHARHVQAAFLVQFDGIDFTSSLSMKI